MSGLFSNQESYDPATVAANAAAARADQLAQQESDRAEAGRISSIQSQLAQETVFRNRGFGLRSLLGPLGSAKTSLLGSG
jgi:hypothetical protein